MTQRRIEGAGTPAARWRAAIDAAPPAPLALPRDARLVVLAPHPDDEVFTCGGLLAHRIATGGIAYVIAATDGEGSHGPLAPGPRAALASRRRDEQAASVAMLGLPESALERWGLPDGGLEAHEAELQHRLAALLRPDDVLVTTWDCDGHPDHEACGRAAVHAARCAGIALLQAPVWAWHWSAPGDPRIAWARLRRMKLPPSARTAKAQALVCHRSQLAPRGPNGAAVLEAAILERAAWPFECYFA